jgi:hypothetical protein
MSAKTLSKGALVRKGKILLFEEKEEKEERSRKQVKQI